MYHKGGRSGRSVRRSVFFQGVKRTIVLFYETFSDLYDLIFPAREETVAFLAEGLGPGSRVLDLACGTGNYACRLAERGFRVVGVDSDPAMIERAKKKCANLPVEFRCGDMRRVNELCDGPFDLVFCIGNSLPHLASEQEAADVVRRMYDLLGRDGRAVLQIVNFERVLRSGTGELPTIELEEKGVVFRRRYEKAPDGRHVFFRVELTVRKEHGVEKLEDRVPLLILEGRRLKELVEEAGFRECRLLGSFAGEPFRDDSPAAVAVGDKP